MGGRLCNSTSYADFQLIRLAGADYVMFVHLYRLLSSGWSQAAANPLIYLFLYVEDIMKALHYYCASLL